MDQPHRLQHTAGQPTFRHLSALQCKLYALACWRYCIRLPKIALGLALGMVLGFAELAVAGVLLVGLAAAMTKLAATLGS